jgi:hypothetical protein
MMLNPGPVSGAVWKKAARAALAIFVILLVLVPLPAGFLAPATPMDEGMLLVYPELLLHGKLPYRDFETFYGPANLGVLAGFYAIFGIKVEVERTVGVLYHFLLIGGIFALARRWNLAAGVGAALLASLILVPVHLAAHAWLGGLACVVWSLVVLGGQPWRGRTILAGGLAAMAILYRQDLGLGVILSLLPFLPLLSRRERLQYAAAFVAGLLPLAVVTVMAGPKSVFENLFLYPVTICNPGRRLPLSSVPDGELFLLFLQVGAATAITIAGLAAVVRDRSSVGARLLLGAGLLAVGTTHQAMQRPDLTHLSFSSCFSIALLPVALVVLGQRGGVGRMATRWSLLSCTGVVLVLAWGYPGYLWHCLLECAGPYFHWTRPPTEIAIRDRRFPLRAPDGSQEVVTFLGQFSVPGERLFVGPGDLRFAVYNDTFLYHLLPWLVPATYFLEMNPFSANRVGSRLASDVASADWLVLDHQRDKVDEPNLGNVPGPSAPNDVVHQQFDLRGRVGLYEIYHRKGARAR